MDGTGLDTVCVCSHTSTHLLKQTLNRTTTIPWNEPLQPIQIIQWCSSPLFPVQSLSSCVHTEPHCLACCVCLKPEFILCFLYISLYLSLGKIEFQCSFVQVEVLLCLTKPQPQTQHLLTPTVEIIYNIQQSYIFQQTRGNYVCVCVCVCVCVHVYVCGCVCGSVSVDIEPRSPLSDPGKLESAIEKQTQKPYS